MRQRFPLAHKNRIVPYLSFAICFPCHDNQCHPSRRERASQERLAEQERQRSFFADAHGRLDCRASEYRQAHALGLIRETEERPGGPPQARVELHPHSLAVCSGPTCYPLKNQIYSPFVPRNFAEDVPKTSSFGKSGAGDTNTENSVACAYTCGDVFGKSSRVQFAHTVHERISEATLSAPSERGAHQPFWRTPALTPFSRQRTC